MSEISDGTMPCPVPSPEGLPCTKRIPEGWAAEDGHAGGHMWMSKSTEEFLDHGHYDAQALLRGDPTGTHAPEDCSPDCPRFWEAFKEDSSILRKWMNEHEQ